MARDYRYSGDAEMAARGVERADWDGANRREVSVWVVAERVGAIGGAILAVGAVLGIFLTNPFMMAAAGQSADANHDARISMLEGRFDGFERNQNLQLEITMQQQIERLNEKIAREENDDYTRQQRLMAIQACQEVKAKLGRPNTRCF